jgi:hypothetical protein
MRPEDLPRFFELLDCPRESLTRRRCITASDCFAGARQRRAPGKGHVDDLERALARHEVAATLPPTAIRGPGSSRRPARSRCDLQPAIAWQANPAVGTTSAGADLADFGCAAFGQADSPG